MESRAILRGYPTSPRKMRLVVNLIRNKRVSDARQVLRLASKHSALPVLKTLNSAVSNFMQRNEDSSVSENDLIVSRVFVDHGVTLKRTSPAPMGRGYRVRKRSNHLTIVIVNEEKQSKDSLG